MGKPLAKHWETIGNPLENLHKAMRKQLKPIGKHHWETMGKPLASH